MANNIENNRFVNGAVGVGAGWASYKFLPKIISKPYGRYLMSEVKDIPENVQRQYWTAGQKAFNTSGLAKSGVDLVDINTTNAEKVLTDAAAKSEEFLNRTLKKFGVKGKIKKVEEKPRPKWQYILFGEDSKSKLQNALKNIAKGNNACFHPATKSIYVNKDKMGFSVFHEMGHAINANGKLPQKMLSYGRHVTAFAVPVMLVTALLKKRKPESDAEPKKVQCKKNFLKDNIGILSFACMLPTVAEEGLASINGAKLAKNVLNADMYKKLNKMNAKAFGSYALIAALVGIFAQIAVYVKDKVVAPKH